MARIAKAVTRALETVIAPATTLLWARTVVRALRRIVKHDQGK